MFEIDVEKVAAFDTKDERNETLKITHDEHKTRSAEYILASCFELEYDA